MRRLLAVALVVLGIAGLVLGRLGETVWAPETERTATVALQDPGPAVLIDPGVAYVGGHAGQVTITAPGDVTVIRAASDDISGYLGDAKYTRITGVPAWGTLSSETVQADGPTELPAPLPDTFGTIEPAPSPVTLEVADLWKQDSAGGQPYQGILLLTDGKQAGASEVTMTWPVDASNPWVPYAYAIGAALAVIGLILFVVDFAMRRSRGAEDDDELVAVGAPEGVDTVAEPVAEPETAVVAASADEPAAVRAPRDPDLDRDTDHGIDTDGVTDSDPAVAAVPDVDSDADTGVDAGVEHGVDADADADSEVAAEAAPLPVRATGRRRALAGDETAPTAPLDSVDPADADGETPEEDPAR